jgi:hypothetical protein
MVTMMRLSGPAPAGPVLASDTAAGPGLVFSGSTGPGLQGQFIRDARLDSYLIAHRRAIGSVAVPGGMPRSLEAFVPIASPSAVVPVAVPVSR